MNDLVMQIVGALSAGAVAAGTDVAGDMVKSAYAALKAAVKARVGAASETLDNTALDKPPAEDNPELEHALASLPPDMLEALSKKIDPLLKAIQANPKLVEALKPNDQGVEVLIGKGAKFFYKNVTLVAHSGKVIHQQDEGSEAGGENYSAESKGAK